MVNSTRRIDIRRDMILRQLYAGGVVSVADLAAALEVTPATIRTDLTALEQMGKLLRVQGGAVLPTGTAGVHRDSPESTRNLAEKTAIAQAVSNLISDGETLFINSGTTTRCVAQALEGKKNLNVVTNSLEVASILGVSACARVVLLGGEINAQYGFTYGGDAQEQLGRYQADWVILSCEGVSEKAGITTFHVEEAVIDRMMIAGAKRALLAADHSKIGHVGFAQVCQYDRKFILVTNARPDEQVVKDLDRSGLKIISTK